MFNTLPIVLDTLITHKHTRNIYHTPGGSVELFADNEVSVQRVANACAAFPLEILKAGRGTLNNKLYIFIERIGDLTHLTRLQDVGKLSRNSAIGLVLNLLVVKFPFDPSRIYVDEQHS